MMRMRAAVFLSLLDILAQFMGPSSLQSQVKINEVYYDHPGADSGWEFIELLNTGPATVDLESYAIEFIDGLSGDIRTLWSGGIGINIPAGSVILVSGENIAPGSARLFPSFPSKKGRDSLKNTD